MGAVWMRVRHDLRIRRSGALALAVLIGLAGAIAMTAAAGARRTSSSYTRLLVQSKGYHAEIQVIGDAEDTILDRVSALPQVAEHGRFAQFVASKGTPGRPPAPFRWDLSVGAIADRALGTAFEKPRVITGRFADFDRPDEAMVSDEFVRQWHKQQGDDFTVQMITSDELGEVFAGRFPTPTGPLVAVHIVGVIRLPHDTSIFEPAGNMFLTPSFYRLYKDKAAQFSGLYVRLKNGPRDFAAFRREVDRIGGPGVLEVQPQEFFAAKVDRALGVQSAALWILAGIVAAGAAMILGQSVARWLTLGADDHSALRALGMGSREIAALSAFEAAVIGLAAGVVAIAGSLVGSLAMPLGLARWIEPNLGLSADVSVLIVGGAAVVVFVAAVGALQGAVLSRRVRVDAARDQRPSSVAVLAARGGVPATMAIGIRFALEPGRGRTSVPVRSALAGATMSVLALVAAFVFGASLARMFGTPAAYGWNWDVLTYGGNDPDLPGDFEQRLSASRTVAEFSRVRVATTRFDGRDIQAASFAPIKGSILPTILDGRFPESANEVALATKTMRLAGVRIGDNVTFEVSREEGCDAADPACHAQFRVVGRVVAWGENADSDEGAGFAEPGLQRIAAGGFNFTDYAVRLPKGVDLHAGHRALKREFKEAGLPNLPPNLKNVRRIRSAPVLLGVILASFGIATIAHLLVTSVRRRSRDIAVLKTLGFVGRQVAVTVAWQAMALAVVAMAVGIPAGIVVGRAVWRVMADRLGIAVIDPSIAGWLAIGAITLAIVANAVALLPGRAAARTRPALVLRTE